MKKMTVLLLIAALGCAALSGCGSDDTTASSASAETELSTDETGTSDGTWADGTYTATAAGKEADFEVTVTIEGGEITDVTCGDNEESEEYGAIAIQAIPKKIIIAQSAEVDAVTGATVTSEAIMNAVAECLEEASN